MTLELLYNIFKKEKEKKKTGDSVHHKRGVALRNYSRRRKAILQFIGRANFGGEVAAFFCGFTQKKSRRWEHFFFLKAAEAKFDRQIHTTGLWQVSNESRCNCIAIVRVFI